MNFIGQSSIIEGFRDKIINNTLGHAYALTGPEGMGKKTIARHIAKMILCTGHDQIPCGRCTSCKSFDMDGNPNFTVIKSETKKILISQIRNLIENISIRPVSGYKVYFIENADRMTKEAQNCLLKTLEEPPNYAVILMSTAYYESLLITVRSRTVQTKLKTYTFEELSSILQVNGIDISGQEHVYNLSSGNPGKAIQLLCDSKFEENRQRIMNFVFDNNVSSNLSLNQYLSSNKEVFSECIDILESVYRDALLVCCGVGDGLINYDKKDNIVKYSNGAKPNEFVKKIHDLHNVRDALKRNMNYQLAVDIVTLNP